MGYQDLRSRKTARTVEVTIVLNDDWGSKVAQLQADVDRVTREAGGIGPAATAAQRELADLTDELDKLLVEKAENTATFRFKGLSRDRYERLMNAHPPTKDQRARAANLGIPALWNSDTFPPALVAACLVEPDDWTEDDVNAMWHDDNWNQAELNELFSAAISACVNRYQVS